MTQTAKRTKRERQRARAEERAAARRRQEQRRRLATVLGGLAVAGLVAVAVIAYAAGGEKDAEPSAAGAVVAGGPPRATPLAPGEAVPAFSAPGLAGGTVAWSDYAGAPAVLSVWASWCPHCQVELPVLDRVMSEFPHVGFVTVVTAIGDRPGPTPQEYMTREGLSFPVAVDDDESSIGQALGIEGYPTLYFVASDGTVVRYATGEVDEGELRAIVAALS
jgi:thiol-disulfide isomerase/thioredoxin